MLDLVVIGSGPGGYRAAVLAAQRRWKVAIVERDAWGGACLNRGCVPKKAWYRSAKLAVAAAQSAVRGLRGALTPDIAQAWRFQRAVSASVRASYVDYLQRLGVQRLEGAARFVDAHRVEVNGTELETRHVIVATGSRPSVPDVLRAAGARVLTTDDLFERPLPSGRRVAVLGSGAVGTELAFILARLGLEVRWLTGAQPLAASRFSAPARTRLAKALAAQGVTPRTGARPRAARGQPDGVVLELADGSTERVDWVLAGTGRVPNTDALGLEAAGVRRDGAGFVEVDVLQRSRVPHVFAIGDCATPAMTANHALAQARTAIEAIAAPDAPPATTDWVPEVVYSALELARAGATEDALETADREYAVGFSSFAQNPAALAEDASEGYARLLVDPTDGRLLGCEMVGPEVGELIHLAGAGARAEALLDRLALGPVNHPSLAETFFEAAESLVAQWGFMPRGE
ncbi:MAG: NAD(P)/FAD-dependent oxidoreductase [Burkholderiales bacterium]|nr:NAD(P)/FAD-dependent oxidoreductase [Burkholderiales bacterium]